jgi:hypothetical protein
MTPMHEQVDDWARREDQVRQEAQDMRPVLGPQEERGDGQEQAQAERYPRVEYLSVRFVIRDHD